MSKRYQYYVEGECEKQLLKSFMYLEEDCFVEGKVEVFNFINEKMSSARARAIKNNTTIVVIVDTDIERIDLLDENINTLKNISRIDEKDIILVFSMKTFEDEIVYASSGIKRINDLLNTKSVDEFKKKFIAHKNIVNKLYNIGFDIHKMWSRKPSEPFDKYINKGSKIIKKSQ